MRKILYIAIGLALVGMTVPAVVANEETIREQNREYILNQIGDEWDPDAEAELRVNGHVHEVSAAEALDHMLDVSENVNLRELSQSASHEHYQPALAGDIVMWLWHECIEPPHTDTPTRTSPLDNQFWLHEGGLMNGTVPDETGVFSPTLKDGKAGEVSYRGNGNTSCMVVYPPSGKTLFSLAMMNGVAY